MILLHKITLACLLLNFSQLTTLHCVVVTNTTVKDNTMLKKAIISLGLLAASSFASAGLIVSQSVVFGSDMVGMDVTVEFSDGSTDSGMWEMISDTLLNTGDPILDQNGLVGGVVTNEWSLTQAGPTAGGFNDNNEIYGVWTLSNLSSSLDIVAFTINGWIDGATKVAFDIDADSIGFPGSDTGQAFTSSASASGDYSNQVDPTYSDLFYQLDVSLDSGLAEGENLLFFADTELMAVPAPATLGLLFGGLVLLFTRKVSAKA